MEPRPTDFLAYVCSIHIDAPPNSVFAVVGDLERTTEWDGSGHVRSIQRVGDGPTAVGTRYSSSEKITMRYSADSEIVAYEPDTLIRWISKPWGERVPYHRWEFRIEGEDDGAKLTHSVRAARSMGFMGLVQRLGFLFTKPERTVPAGMERTILNVKRLAEATTQSA